MKYHAFKRVAAISLYKESYVILFLHSDNTLLS